MSGLADVLQPLSDERPGAALLRLLLAHTICVLSLVAGAAGTGEPFSEIYVYLAVIVFVVALQIFGEMPLANGEPRPEPGGARQGILAHWAAVVAVLLMLGFISKLSSLYSRKLMLLWFAATPFALLAARYLSCRFLARVMVGAAG